jgi:hypothetical protein
MPKEKDEGTHTSSQLQSVNLPLWTEVVGVFNGLSSDDSRIYVNIGNKTLCLPKESIESEIELDKLHQGLIGQKIGLLRTDEPMKQLVVRLIDK